MVDSPRQDAAVASSSADGTSLRVVHEEVRRGIARLFTRLESRQQRIKDFEARVQETEAASSSALEGLRRELNALLPTESDSAMSKGENTRLEAQRLARDNARREAHAASVEMAAAQEAANSRDTQVRDLVEMKTWFYAPAHRQPLAHRIPVEPRS